VEWFGVASNEQLRAPAGEQAGSISGRTVTGSVPGESRSNRRGRGVWTHYFEHLDAVKPIVSAVLAVLLWPLVLLGVNLHLK